MPSAKRTSSFSDFISFAAVILQGGGAQGLLSVFEKRTGTGVCLRSKNKLLIATSSSAFEEQMRTYPYKELLRIFYHVALEDGGQVIFNVPTCDVPEALQGDIEYLCLSLRLLKMGERSQQVIEQRYREQFIQDLLFSRIHYEEELRNRSSLYGWDLSGSVIVLVAEFMEQTGQGSRECAALLKGRVKMLYPDMIFSDGHNKETFLIPLTAGRQIKKDFQLIAPSLREELGNSAYLGFSGEHTSFLQAGEAYQEASQALSIAKNFLKKRRLIFWDELGAYKLLSDMIQNRYAQHFVQDTLGELIQADEHYNGELLKTLQTLESCGWNFSAAAEKLHVHYNTLKYRYKKLEALLHLKVNDSEQRFSIILALHLYRLCQSDDLEETSKVHR